MSDLDFALGPWAFPRASHPAVTATHAEVGTVLTHGTEHYTFDMESNLLQRAPRFSSDFVSHDQGVSSVERVLLSANATALLVDLPYGDLRE